MHVHKAMHSRNDRRIAAEALVMRLKTSPGWKSQGQVHSDMINSPSEQLNILPVYDASLVYTSISEITHVKILLIFRYTFYNLPETILLHYQLLSGAISPMFGLLSNTVLSLIPGLFPLAVPPVGESSLIESLTLAIADYSMNPIHDPYHSCLSFVWYTSYTDSSLLYSADHLYITKIFGSLDSSDAAAHARSA